MNYRHFIARIHRIVSKLINLFPNGTAYKTKYRILAANYKLFGKKKKPNEHRVIILFKKGTPNTPGLADRINAAVTAYIIAQENDYNFYYYHDVGFRMESYLMPHEVPWLIDLNDISLGLGKFKILWNATQLIKLDRNVKEYHAYHAYDLYSILPDNLKEKYDFTRVFHKLFKESTHLKEIIGNTLKATGIVENEFIAVHVRFLNFFEAVEQNPKYTPYIKLASEENQKAMIHSVHATLENIHNQHPDIPIILFSDSPKFLSSNHADYIHQVPGEVGHIHVHAGNDNVTDKAFIDLFVMSKAKKIYNIIGPDTYKSGYPLLASRIGGKPFERIERILP